MLTTSRSAPKRRLLATSNMLVYLSKSKLKPFLLSSVAAWTIVNLLVRRLARRIEHALVVVVRLVLVFHSCITTRCDRG